MKRLRLRVSNLLKVSVLALIFSVFLQASLASANGTPINLDQTNFYSTITTDILNAAEADEANEDYIGGNYLLTEGINIAGVNDAATVFGTFTGILDGDGFTISGLTKPLFAVISQAPVTIDADDNEIDTVEVKNLILESSTFVDGNGALANVSHGTIDNVSSSVNVIGSAYGGETTVGIGGLVGRSEGTITNSDVTGTVDGDMFVGGLVGFSSGAISNSYTTGLVTGSSDYVGGLVGYSSSYGDISNSYATGNVIGLGGYIGGLVGESYGTITDSHSTGNINDPDESGVLFGYEVGGLVGYLGGTLDNTYATGSVIGKNSVGGLVGETGGSFADISNSYAKGFVGGYFNVGGLVGYSDISITNSYATGYVTAIDDPLTGTEGAPSIEGYGVGGLVGALSYYGDISNSSISNSYATGFVWGTNDVGGLVGSSYSTNSTINNSYAAGEVTGGRNFVGGLVGYSLGVINNSYAIGDVYGVNSLGGLVGTVSEEGTITDSYATGDVTSISLDPYYIGGLVGYSSFKDVVGDLSDEQISLSSYSTGTVTISDELQIGDMYASSAPAPYILDIVNTSFAAPNLPFAVDVSINDGLPYLTSLELSYDVVEEDTEETPSYSLRSYYTQAAKSLNKALAPFGFKSNFSSHPNLGFQALEQNQSKLPAVIQLFEVSEYQNSNILLNKEDGLQLSISSYYKEPVEIWTQGLNGEYLYLGLIEFDKDGKAILPTLKFDTANTYQLLMIKAADKVSEKPNLERKIGEITINVF